MKITNSVSNLDYHEFSFLSLLFKSIIKFIVKNKNEFNGKIWTNDYSQGKHSKYFR